jgi:ankyrin repeat protein
MRRILPLLPAALLLACLPSAVDAQGMVRPQQQQRPQVGPAPALPGLAARRAPAPIEADPNANLPPTAALFDAINRGDLPAAREAVSRGASLDAQNQLGLTPLDAAVDQGRNEIAFYLLSARDLSRTPPLPPEPAGTAGLNQPPARPASRSPARREVAEPAALGAATPRGARLWAGDGGTARPEIGFLGFDAGRPAGATPPPEAASQARRGGRG